ncbi:MAG: hypothetical protein Kow0047_26070 [Anaerolineae bacterium]
MTSDEKARWLAIVITLMGGALRFWRLGDPPLVGDESYYWLWSEHLAWSYFDHPGGVAWMIRASTGLGGPSEFGVRWLNAMLAALAPFLLYGLGRRTGNPGAGVLAAATLAFAPGAIIVARHVYTDTLPIVLMLVAFHAMWPMIMQQGSRQLGWRWLATGLVGALLMNTKLSAYPLFVGVALAVVCWRRELLKDRRLWASLGIIVLGLIPSLAWNLAHDYAGWRWTWQQFTAGTVRARGPLSIVHHMITYLTPPFIALAAVGFLEILGRQHRWLVVPALLLAAPVLVSPANSPRNLLLGATLLLVPAAAWWSEARARRWTAGALLLALLIYGVGTTQGLVQPTKLPRSSVVDAIRYDGIGWPDLGRELADEPGLIFTADYSVASQLWFYARRPVHTAWEQYRLWGIPPFDTAVVIAEPYVPAERVDHALRGVMAHVEGPTERAFHPPSEPLVTKRVRLWRASGPQVDPAQFANALDFFTLYGEER